MYLYIYIYIKYIYVFMFIHVHPINSKLFATTIGSPLALVKGISPWQIFQQGTITMAISLVESQLRC